MIDRDQLDPSQFSGEPLPDAARGGQKPGLSDLSYQVYETDEARRQQEREQAESSPGLWEGAGRALQSDWSLLQTFDGMEEYAPDPDFELAEDDVKEYMKGIPTQYWDYLEDAQSDAQAKAMAKRAQKDWENEQELGKMGWTGVGLRTAAAITDPQAWAIGAAVGTVSGGAGMLYTAGKKISRIQRIARSAGVGAASNLAAEGALAAEKPIYDKTNLIYAAALGGGVGAGFGTLAHSRAASKETAEFERLTKEVQNEVSESVRQGTDSVGAARVSRVQELSKDYEAYGKFEAETDAPMVAMAKARFDLAARGGGSPNPYTRAAYSQATEETVGNADRNVATAVGATERQVRVQRQNEIKWRRSYEPSFKRWHKQKYGGKTRWFKKGDDRVEFSREVADYVRGINETPSAEVKKVGEDLRGLLDDYRQRLNQPGAYRGEFRDPVTKDGQLEQNPNYLPREFDMRKVNELVNEFGDPNLTRFIADAFKKGTASEIDDGDALHAAGKYLDTIRRLDAGIGSDTARMLTQGDSEELKTVLKREADMTDAEIEDLVDSLTVKKQGGTPANLKSRMQLDEGHKAFIKRNPETGQGSREVRFTELLNNDVDDLFQKYNRRMSGSLAMAEFRIPGLTDGITSSGQWETLKTRIKEKGVDIGQDQNQLRKEIEGLDFLYDSVMGIPQRGDNSDYAQFLKQFRDYNFARLMGQVGFAQIPEFGVVASSIGFKGMLQSMPSFRALWRNAQTGKLDDAMADELELFTGIGGDWLKGAVVHRWNEATGAPDTFMGNSPKMQKVEAFNHAVKRGVFAASGMSTVNTGLQRWSLNAIAHKFDRMARGLDSMNPARLRQMNLTEGMEQRIYEQMKTHVTRDSRGRMKQMNLHQWDRQTASDFQNAMFKYSRRLVQENDPGQMQEWMSKPTAQTLLQFRSFIIGACTKNFLHNLHMRDRETWVSFITQSFMAGLSYIGQTYLRGTGRDDREEYLDSHLKISDVAKASFSRAGWASILPTAFDTGMLLTGQDRQFGYRSTGQSQDLLFGNPTGDLFENAEGVLGGVVNSVADDRAMSQEELNKLWQLLPMQNVMGLAQAGSFMLKESGLPKWAPRE